MRKGSRTNNALNVIKLVFQVYSIKKLNHDHSKLVTLSLLFEDLSSQLIVQAISSLQYGMDLMLCKKSTPMELTS